MSKILKNNTASNVVISDVGQTVLASSQLTINHTDYLLYADSSDVVTLVGDGTLTVNDGSEDLSISNGIDLIKGVFQKNRIIGNTDSTLIGNEGNKLLVKMDAVDQRELLDIFGDIWRQLKIMTAHLEKISDLELEDGDEEDFT